MSCCGSCNCDPCCCNRPSAPVMVIQPPILSQAAQQACCDAKCKTAQTYEIVTGFVMPALDTDVQIQVCDSSQYTPGEFVYLLDINAYLRIMSLPGPNLILVRNLSTYSATNPVPGTVMPSGRMMVMAPPVSLTPPTISLRLMAITQAVFTVPVIGGTVGIILDDASWVYPSGRIFIMTAGWFTATVVAGNNVTILNDGTWPDANPGTNIAAFVGCYPMHLPIMDGGPAGLNQTLVLNGSGQIAVAPKFMRCSVGNGTKVIMQTGFKTFAVPVQINTNTFGTLGSVDFTTDGFEDYIGPGLVMVNGTGMLLTVTLVFEPKNASATGFDVVVFNFGPNILVGTNISCTWLSFGTAAVW